MITYFQGSDNVLRTVINSCSVKLGCAIYHGGPVYWAWDRQLGAWIHYAK